jgi:hypothetical protein
MLDNFVGDFGHGSLLASRCRQACHLCVLTFYCSRLLRAMDASSTSGVNGATSIVAWDRAELWRDIVGEIEEDLVDVAPAPAFRWVITFDDRMSRRVKMLSCMTVWRVVATAILLSHS